MGFDVFTTCPGSGRQLPVTVADMTTRPVPLGTRPTHVIDRPRWAKCPVCGQVVVTTRKWHQLDDGRFQITVGNHR